MENPLIQVRSPTARTLLAVNYGALDDARIIYNPVQHAQELHRKLARAEDNKAMLQILGGITLISLFALQLTALFAETTPTYNAGYLAGTGAAISGIQSLNLNGNHIDTTGWSTNSNIIAGNLFQIGLTWLAITGFKIAAFELNRPKSGFYLCALITLVFTAVLSAAFSLDMSPDRYNQIGYMRAYTDLWLKFCQNNNFNSTLPFNSSDSCHSVFCPPQYLECYYQAPADLAGALGYQNESSNLLIPLSQGVRMAIVMGASVFADVCLIAARWQAEKHQALEAELSASPSNNV